MAARTIGPWIFTAEQQARLLELARRDESVLVREALFDTLPALGLPTARAFLLEIAGSESQPDAVRELAREARRRLAISS